MICQFLVDYYLPQPLALTNLLAIDKSRYFAQPSSIIVNLVFIMYDTSSKHHTGSPHTLIQLQYHLGWGIQTIKGNKTDKCLYSTSRQEQ